MARFDKYEPFAGGFRAALAADFTDATKFGRPIPVGLDVNGNVVQGAGTSGILGVMVLTSRKYVGAIVDIMTSGEIIEWDPVTAGTFGTPATVYYSNAAGVISTTNTGVRLGHTVKGDRFVCRVEATQGAGSA